LLLGTAWLLGQLTGLRDLLLDHLLVLGVFLFDVIEEVSEESGVIHDELVDDGPVDVLRWELVGVSLFYHFGHLGEVLGDGLGVVLYN
jgi:hypothetical protein